MEHDWEVRTTPEGWKVMHCTICDLPSWGDVNIKMLPSCPATETVALLNSKRNAKGRYD